MPPVRPAPRKRRVSSQGSLLHRAGVIVGPVSFMFNIRVKADFTGVRAFLANADKRVKDSTAIALTKTAQDAQAMVKVEMQRVFHEPTRYTLNATRLIPATRQRLISQVWLKDRRGQPQGKDTNFLFPEVFGGTRGRKAFETRLLRAGWLRSNEFVVPAKDYPLDANGNMPAGIIRSILSQAKAAGGLGYSSNATSSARSKRTVAKRGTYFVSRGESTGSPLPRGIYQRLRLGSGWATRMVFKIVVGKPRYRPRLRLIDINEKAARNFQRHFDEAWQRTASFKYSR
jgi:hypothetical protein